MNDTFDIVNVNFIGVGNPKYHLCFFCHGTFFKKMTCPFGNSHIPTVFVKSYLYLTIFAHDANADVEAYADTGTAAI